MFIVWSLFLVIMNGCKLHHTGVQSIKIHFSYSSSCVLVGCLGLRPSITTSLDAHSSTFLMTVAWRQENAKLSVYTVYINSLALHYLLSSAQVLVFQLVLGHLNHYSIQPIMIVTFFFLFCWLNAQRFGFFYLTRRLSAFKFLLLKHNWWNMYFSLIYRCQYASNVYQKVRRRAPEQN